MTEYLPSRSPSPTGSDSSRRPLPHLPELAPGTPLDSVEERSETSSPEIVFRPGASVARSTEDGGSDDSSEGVPKTPELHSDADMPAVTATRSTLAVDAAPYGLPDLRQSSPFMLDVASMALSRESSLDKRTVAAPRPNFITREALLGSRESTPTPADYDPPKRRSVVEASPEPEDLLGDTSTSSRADLKSVYSGGGTSPLERLGARMLFSPDPALDGQSPISGGDAFPSAVKPGSKLSSVEYATESEEEDGEDGTVEPPPLPPKVDKSAYEDAIMAKRRELRDREDGGERRRSRPRRSMSTGALPAMETERSQPPARPSSLAISASTFNMSFAEGLSTDLDSIRRSVDVRRRTWSLAYRRSNRTARTNASTAGSSTVTTRSRPSRPSAARATSTRAPGVESVRPQTCRTSRCGTSASRPAVSSTSAVRSPLPWAALIPRSEAARAAWRADPASRHGLPARRLRRLGQGRHALQRPSAHGAQRAARGLGV